MKLTLSILFALVITGCSIVQFDTYAWKQKFLSANHQNANNKIHSDKGDNPINNKSPEVLSRRPLLTQDQQCVVLVHGLWRSAFAMRSIENFLLENDYLVVNISYPSTTGTIYELADQYLSPAVKECQNKSETTHIVTHSMGGIVAQAFLQNNRLNRRSKVVMLSPPSKGSELSDQFYENGFFGFFAGNPAMSLHSNEEGIIKELTEFPETLGVIAGYRTWSFWPESLLPSPNDGMVSVQSMMTKGLDDIAFVNTGHAMMRYNDEVKALILEFLQFGRFESKEQS